MRKVKREKKEEVPAPQPTPINVTIPKHEEISKVAQAQLETTNAMRDAAVQSINNPAIS